MKSTNTDPSRAAGALVRVEFPLDGCALVTMNRPQAKNALSVALRRATAWAERLSAAGLAQRRESVLQRGRAQEAGKGP